VKPALKTRFWCWLRGITLVPYTTLIATANRDAGHVRSEFDCLPGDEPYCVIWRATRLREGMTVTTRSGYKAFRTRELTPAMRVASELHKRAGWPDSEEIRGD
jgi:hypothetical protein